MVTSNCQVKYWIRDGDLNGVVTMAMLGTVVFIFGIFANLLMAIPIIFNRVNRQKHLQFFSIAVSNILFLSVGIPLIMQVSGEHNFQLGDECNGWLPFVVIFFISKSVLDSSTYSVESYLDILFRSDDLKTAIIVFRVTSFAITFVIPLVMSCLFVWINTYRVVIVLIVIYVISFLVNFVCVFYSYQTLKQRIQAVRETDGDELNNQDEPLLPNFIMVSTSFVLIGQCLINLMIWDRHSVYLNGQLIFSIIVCAYNSLTFPMLVSWEKRILQKFYYKNCLNHRVVVPIN